MVCLMHIFTNVTIHLHLVPPPSIPLLFSSLSSHLFLFFFSFLLPLLITTSQGLPGGCTDTPQFRRHDWVCRLVQLLCGHVQLQQNQPQWHATRVSKWLTEEPNINFNLLIFVFSLPFYDMWHYIHINIPYYMKLACDMHTN